MKYLLLLKRLLKKKSYIAMLLVVPILVFLLDAMSAAPSGLMTIGVYCPGDDASSERFMANLEEVPGSLRFISYDDEDELVADVENQQLSEGWIIPEDLDEVVADMASRGKTKHKIQIVIRESGLTHMLGREVLCSRVYPLIARQIAANYIDEKVYAGAMTESEREHVLDIYDNYGINGNLFEMGYLDGTDQVVSDTSYLMMPLRGILALWLMLCAIAASMYYLEDEANGLFIWWKTRFFILRDIMYYLVIMLIPSIMVLLGLQIGGVFTSFPREVAAIAAYDMVSIAVACLLREIIRSIKGIGIITPIIIMASALLSPVFIDFKEGRSLQRFCPTFHYLYSIHDLYYLKNLLVYSIAIFILWYIINTIIKKLR